MVSKTSSTVASVNCVTPASSIRVSFASSGLEPGQADTFVSGLRRYVLLARACGADLKDRQGVLRTLDSVHRSWSLVIPAEFRPVCHELVLRLASQCPTIHPSSFRFIVWCIRPKAGSFLVATWKLLTDSFYIFCDM